MSDSSYFVNGQEPDTAGGDAPECKPGWSAPRGRSQEETGMDEMIADRKRDFIPASPVLWAFDPFIAVFTREGMWRGALLEQLKPGNSDIIADLGCGTGSFLVLVREQAPISKLIGIDPDAAVL